MVFHSWRDWQQWQCSFSLSLTIMSTSIFSPTFPMFSFQYSLQLTCLCWWYLSPGYSLSCQHLTFVWYAPIDHVNPVLFVSQWASSVLRYVFIRHRQMCDLQRPAEFPEYNKIFQVVGADSFFIHSPWIFPTFDNHHNFRCISSTISVPPTQTVKLYVTSHLFDKDVSH